VPRGAIFPQNLETGIAYTSASACFRDCFGLAHFDPKMGETMPVVLMSYPAWDLLQAACKQTDAMYPCACPPAGP